jgi:hypothetical protein
MTDRIMPNDGLTLSMVTMTASEALEVADRLHKIAGLPSRTPRERRTTDRLSQIAEALERYAET